MVEMTAGWGYSKRKPTSEAVMSYVHETPEAVQEEISVKYYVDLGEMLGVGLHTYEYMKFVTQLRVLFQRSKKAVAVVRHHGYHGLTVSVGERGHLGEAPTLNVAASQCMRSSIGLLLILCLKRFNGSVPAEVGRIILEHIMRPLFTATSHTASGPRADPAAPSISPTVPSTPRRRPASPSFNTSPPSRRVRPFCSNDNSQQPSSPPYQPPPPVDAATTAGVFGPVPQEQGLEEQGLPHEPPVRPVQSVRPRRRRGHRYTRRGSPS